MGPAACVVSLDFEQPWGMRDLHTIERSRAALLGARAAVPALLALFAEFDVRATWATVGLLFFESRAEMLAALPASRPSYAAARLSPYADLGNVGESERDDPFHFAPSLIRRIADTPGQEIATHTFSNYYCCEPGQTVDQFRADLEAAALVARRRIGRAPESIVFPRNQMTPDHLAVCRDVGLLAYRGNPDHWAYTAAHRDAAQSPARRALRLADAYLPLTGRHSAAMDGDAELPVDVPASRYLRPYSRALRALEPLRLRRITVELETAATDRRVFHLWWHPHDFGVHVRENLAFLRRVLARFARVRERTGMESVTMSDVARRRLGCAEERTACR